MTFPNVVKLLLIFAPSLSLVPLAPVDSARSEPAKSTNDILLTFSAVNPEALSNLCWVKMMVNTAWDREEVSFMLVAATVLEYSQIKNCTKSAKSAKTRTLTWPYFPRPSTRKCLGKKWLLAWTNPRRKDPKADALWPSSSLCCSDSANP